jgi:hypothetical protein
VASRAIAAANLGLGCVNVVDLGASVPESLAVAGSIGAIVFLVDSGTRALMSHRLVAANRGVP